MWNNIMLIAARQYSEILYHIIDIKLIDMMINFQK